MRKTRFSEEQIAMALRQGEVGTPVAEIIRKLGISEQTYYRWRKRYGGLGASELRELKVIREENRRLKTLVADLSLDKTILQEALRKKMVSPRQRRAGVRWAREAYRLPERRACRAIGCLPLHGALRERATFERAAEGSPEGTSCGARELRLSTTAHHASP